MPGPAKRLLLTALKLFLLAVVTFMIAVQIPELRYDLGPKTPKVIAGPDDLTDELHGRVTFVSVKGTAFFEKVQGRTRPSTGPATRPSYRFDKALRYDSHGVPFVYFLLRKYGDRLVVRSGEKPSEQWRHLDRFVGRLKRIRRMPFSGTVRRGFRDRFGVEIGDDAFFLARDDVPRLSAWQLGAVIFAALLWVVLFYFFFLWRRGRRRQARPAAAAADTGGED